MTLIHDYHGDPNQTYYNSHQLAAGWLPGYPTYSVHTAEDSYQGNISITKATVLSDNTVFAQLDADLGPDKVRSTAYAMGITTHLDGLPAEAIGGLRIGVTPLEMADAYSTLANGGSHVPATIINKVVFPDGSVRNFGDPPHKRGLHRRRGLRGHHRPQGRDHQRHRHRGQLRLPGGRQDRHGGELRERLVRRLHAADVDRGLGRLSAGQHPDGQRLRRHAGGADLARLHVDGLGRLLRQLPHPDHAVQRHRLLRAPLEHRGASSTLPRTSHSAAASATAPNPYNNPTLFAQPPQPAPGAGGGNGAGPASPAAAGGGNGAGGLNGGNGNGHGGGKKP